MSCSVTYSEWENYLFRRPERSSDWWYQETLPEPLRNLTPTQAVEFYTTLFSEPDRLKRFNPTQVVSGLYYAICSEGDVSPWIYSIVDSTVPLENRIRCARSTIHLFENYFASNCLRQFSHLNNSKPGVDCNTLCYMFWELIPWQYDSSDSCRAVDDEYLAIIQRLMNHEHIALVESSLHGLGHAVLDSILCHDEARSAKYRGMLARWLVKRRHALGPELRKYAREVGQGTML